ncbi:hypothetical protein [Geodermatophilus sp. FMUSA9-8]|uniref:hypothetical protein n=1 Tax=Geodermatophilus sp. FMUSA9-8 TaxID=3120155 RepID=UPI0030084A3A
MSMRRLVVTTAAMAAVAAVLAVLTPDPSWLSAGSLQRAVDTAGPEAVLLSAVAAAAWLAWAWGALGLVLTALSALPGLAGAAAAHVLRGVLPAAGRRAAALALGVGLAATPVLTGCTGSAAVVPAAATASAGTPAATTPAAVPDWPTAPAATPTGTPTTPVPDWPLPAPGDHVVLRGECLWSIAEADLRERTGREPADAEVAEAVGRWWSVNADVIGTDPDLLLPGQVLRPPA